MATDPSVTLPTFRRPVFHIVLTRLGERRRFIQVLAGPRQVGKTTLARQVLAAVPLGWHYASADDPGFRTRAWLETQWDIARMKATDGGRGGAVLIVDEIQKIPAWSDLVKRLWDEDTRTGTRLKAVLLGSAPWLIDHGLTESLAGRFEIVRVPHWSFSEMRAAFAVTTPDRSSRIRRCSASCRMPNTTTLAHYLRCLLYTSPSPRD